MNILTALKDGELTPDELWAIAQTCADEIVAKQGSNVLERFPVFKPGDKVTFLHTLVQTALLGDIRDKLDWLVDFAFAAQEALESEGRPALKELVNTNQQIVTLLTLLADKARAGPEDVPDSYGERPDGGGE